MRNISFSMTTAQVRSGTKTVTRRLGWDKIKLGEVLMAIEKGQGLKRGESVKKIRPIRVVGFRKEPLNWLILYPLYGRSEVTSEGFPELTADEFVEMFCKASRRQPNTLVNRIEFEYVEL